MSQSKLIENYGMNLRFLNFLRVDNLESLAMRNNKNGRLRSDACAMSDMRVYYTVLQYLSRLYAT